MQHIIYDINQRYVIDHGVSSDHKAGRLRILGEKHVIQLQMFEF